MKKKILFIANVADTPMGSFFRSSYEAAQRENLEFHVAYHWADRTPEKIAILQRVNNIFFHQIDFMRNPLHAGNMSAYRQLLALMRREQFDIVHCNTALAGFIGRLCAAQVGCPHIIFMAHGFVYYRDAPFLQRTLFKWLEKFPSRWTDVQIVINHEDYNYAQGFPLRNNGQVVYVHGVGADLLGTETVTEDEKRRLRAELHLNADDIVLSTTGELNWNKNTITAIRVMMDVCNPNLKLLICGEGPKFKYLSKQVERAGLSRQVLFLGYRKDVPTILSISDIFIFPSFCEGLSRSLMEAMAMGLPCLVSLNRGNSDLIEDGRGGYLYEPKDVGGFSGGLRHLLDNSAIRQNFGNYNIEKIREFSLPIVIEEIRKIYHSVLQQE